MVVKFFGNKKGGSSKAIDYLLNEREAQGTAKVLQGDPQLTKDLINSIQYKQKVTVGCLSFEEKNISEEMKYQLMQDFENHLLPGMENRYNILWVEHTDKGRLELNFVIPKIDLESQKSLNPYYHKADLPRVEKWQDLQNLKYNYSSPKDPSKQRTLQTDSKEIGLSRDYEQLDKLLHNLTEQGQINNREQLIELLQSNQIEVTRKGKDYLSIKLPDSKKARKFKGGIYDEQFTSIGAVREISTRAREEVKQYNTRDTQRELTRLKSQLREYTQDKYEKLQQIYNRTPQRELTRDNAVQQERQKTNNISHSDIRDNNRGNINDNDKTLSNTEREPRSTDSRSINGDKSRTIQQSNQGLQQLEEQSREPRERNRTVTEIQPRASSVASTERVSDERKTREVYSSTEREDIHRTREQNLYQNRGLDDDSTRTTVNARTGTRESTKYRDYRETRKARTELYKSIAATANSIRESTISNSRELHPTHRNTTRDIQQRIRIIENEHKQVIQQSESHLQQAGDIEHKSNGLTKLRQFGRKLTSYIETARSYIKDRYNDLKQRYDKNFVYKQEDLEKTFSVYDLRKDVLKKELSFNDINKVQKQFDISADRDIKEEQQAEQERQRSRSYSRGYSL